MPYAANYTYNDVLLNINLLYMDTCRPNMKYIVAYYKANIEKHFKRMIKLTASIVGPQQWVSSPQTAQLSKWRFWFVFFLVSVIRLIIVIITFDYFMCVCSRPMGFKHHMLCLIIGMFILVNFLSYIISYLIHL